MARAGSDEGAFRPDLGITLSVVAHRDAPSLSRLLESWSGVGPAVVINVEADESVRRAADVFGAQVVDVVDNCGFAAGVNKAAAMCSTARLLFCNDDVWFATDPSKGLRAAMESDWPVVVPRHVDERGIPMRSLRRLATPAGFLTEWVVLPDQPMRLGRAAARVQKWRMPTGPEAIEAATAAAVLVEVDVLRALPMPEEYFLYWEEIDWFWQLHDAGVGAGIVPLLSVTRTGGRSEVGAQKWWLLGRNLVRLGRGRYGGVGRVLYALLGLAWVTRLACSDIAAADRRQRLVARWWAAKGVVAGAQEHR